MRREGGNAKLNKDAATERRRNHIGRRAGNAHAEDHAGNGDQQQGEKLASVREADDKARKAQSESAISHSNND